MSAPQVGPWRVASATGMDDSWTFVEFETGNYLNPRADRCELLVLRAEYDPHTRPSPDDYLVRVDMAAVRSLLARMDED